MSVTIILTPIIDTSNVLPSIRLCEGKNFTQQINAYPNANYSWVGPNNFSSTKPNFSLFNVTTLDEGLYTLTINIENSCQNNILKTVSTYINVDLCAVAANIPNYFTPNGDGIHDQWIIDPNVFSFKNIYIFNSYGKQLTELTPNKNSWDGTYNGELLPNTDYWYVINFANGEKDYGHFSLKR